MAGILIRYGVCSGALAGFVAFLFARIFAEPWVQAAIDYETGRDQAQAALDRATGVPPAPDHPELFSRGVQGGLGLGTGMVLFGIAMGALVAVAYVLCSGRVGAARPRVLALLVAGAGFLGFCLVPFLKYPANPPSIGHPETIGARTGLHLAMVVASLALLVAAVWLGRRLRTRFGAWTASLLAGAAFVVAIGVVMAVLPPLGHLSGDQLTETPAPLRDAAGAIVYPGFPADVLFGYRLSSLATQLVLWVALGLVFAALVDRLARRASREPTPFVTQS